MSTTVLLADDHALVRAGLRALVDAMADATVIGEADDGPAALDLVARLAPRVALVNISLPVLNGIEVAARLVRAQRPTRVLLCSAHADEAYVRRAFAVGAAGYLLKAAEPGELELAIRAVARGEAWLSASLPRAVLTALVRGGPAPDHFELLTARQREVLQLVAEGVTTKEIAGRLRLSIRTVESHRAQLMRRLGARNAVELARCAVRLGIVRDAS